MTAGPGVSRWDVRVNGLYGMEARVGPKAEEKTKEARDTERGANS